MRLEGQLSPSASPLFDRKQQPSQQGKGKGLGQVVQLSVVKK
jgi:hypothetical protein